MGTQGILSSQEAGGPAICNIMDEPGGYCAAISHTQKEKHLLGLAYLWNLKKSDPENGSFQG